VNVRGCEAQQHEAGVDQPVLTAIVFHQSVPMVAAVVLDNESCRWVVEISPPNESTVDIVKLRLDLRRRQAGSQ